MCIRDSRTIVFKIQLVVKESNVTALEHQSCRFEQFLSLPVQYLTEVAYTAHNQKPVVSYDERECVRVARTSTFAEVERVEAWLTDETADSVRTAVCTVRVGTLVNVYKHTHAVTPALFASCDYRFLPTLEGQSSVRRLFACMTHCCVVSIVHDPCMIDTIQQCVMQANKHGEFSMHG